MVTSTIKKIIIYVILLILVIVVIAYNIYSNTPLPLGSKISGYKNTNVMTAWTTSRYAQCPDTFVPNLCVVSTADIAKSTCDANPKCVGFWARSDVNWIKNDGKIYYQLIEDLSTKMDKIPAVLYTK